MQPFDQILSIARTLLVSALLTKVEWVRFLFCLVSFLVRMWLLKACFLLILPVPVSLKRFFALDLVFTFGISIFFKDKQNIAAAALPSVFWHGEAISSANLG